MEPDFDYRILTNKLRAVEGSKSTLLQQVMRLEVEVDSCRRDEFAYEEKLSSMAQTVGALTNHIASTQKALELRRDEIEGLNAKLAAAEGALRQKLDELGLLKQENGQLSWDNAALQENLRELRLAIETAETQRSEAENAARKAIAAAVEKYGQRQQQFKRAATRYVQRRIGEVKWKAGITIALLTAALLACGAYIGLQFLPLSCSHVLGQFMVACF